MRGRAKWRCWSSRFTVWRTKRSSTNRVSWPASMRYVARSLSRFGTSSREGAEHHRKTHPETEWFYNFEDFCHMVDQGLPAAALRTFSAKFPISFTSFLALCFFVFSEHFWWRVVKEKTVGNANHWNDVWSWGQPLRSEVNLSKYLPMRTINIWFEFILAKLAQNILANTNLDFILFVVDRTTLWVLYWYLPLRNVKVRLDNSTPMSDALFR